MYDFILVPVDGSEASTVALNHALEIASDHQATIHLLFVADTNEPSLVQYDGTVIDVLEQKGEEILSDAREEVEQRGVPVVDNVVQGNTGPIIVESANQDIVDLVVMGTHGQQGLRKYVLGSVTEHVVNACQVPVLTVRAAKDVTVSYPYENILVPTDGSDHALTAVQLGSEIATYHNATLHLLSIINESPLGVALAGTPTANQLEKHAYSILDESEAVAADGGAKDIVTTVESGSIPREIQKAAETENIDCIVMGTHGRTGLNQHLLGSITERVLRTAPVPVLTTNEPTGDKDNEPS